MSAWTRSSRAQKPWKVPIGAPSVSRAASRSPSSSRRARTRSRSSPAARSVKVIARIRAGAMPSSRTARTKRSTSTEVLPLPAPAASSSGPRRRAAACSCSAVKDRGGGGLDAQGSHRDRRWCPEWWGRGLNGRTGRSTGTCSRCPEPAGGGPRLELPRARLRGGLAGHGEDLLHQLLHLRRGRASPRTQSSATPSLDLPSASTPRARRSRPESGW